MSFRSRVLGLLEVALRVPPLFVIDEILKIGLGISDFSEHELSNFDEKSDTLQGNTYNDTTNSNFNNIIIYRLVFITILRLVLSILGLYLLIK